MTTLRCNTLIVDCEGGFGVFGGLGDQLAQIPQFGQLSRISDCPTTDGNRTGICVRSTSECTSRGGRPLGTCYATPQTGTHGVQSE